jgi:hypothetical protein
LIDGAGVKFSSAYQDSKSEDYLATNRETRSVRYPKTGNEPRSREEKKMPHTKIENEIENIESDNAPYHQAETVIESEEDVKFSYPKTGSELKKWREEILKMDRPTFALAINRRSAIISGYEGNKANDPLPSRLIDHVLPRYFSKDGQKHRIDSDVVWDDFNDEDAGIWNTFNTIKGQLNNGVADRTSRIHRLALTDIVGEDGPRRGRIWVASDQSVPGCEIGDRLLRRAVENFHDRARERDGSFMHHERHQYQFFDEATGLKYACSAKAINSIDPRTNSEWTLLFLSKDDFWNPLFTGKAHAMCDLVRETLMDAKMVARQ